MVFDSFEGWPVGLVCDDRLGCCRWSFSSSVMITIAESLELWDVYLVLKWIQGRRSIYGGKVKMISER